MPTVDWIEYVVRAKRWIRDVHGERVWETVELKATTEGQARDLYDGIVNGNGALEKPEIIVRHITERPLKLKPNK